MILTFKPFNDEEVQFNVDRRMVGEELYVIFSPSHLDPESFPRAVQMIRATVLRHLLYWPNDKYLARFYAGDADDNYSEVQFGDRDDLRYPKWQRVLVNPWVNSREAA
jgi:hypothetical protein